MLSVVVTVLLLALVWASAIVLRLPLVIAVAATAAVAAAWGLVLGLRWWRARRAAGQIEKALQSQADAHAQAARPDQQAEIEAMHSEFTRAVATLKRSRLGRGGRDALAVLPWYMIIGPPGAGKSTALRASGLKFPYLSKRGGVRGIGGTRNCEWWLTNEAVLLDTAGRYATEEEDHDEWMGFLDVLARTRPRKPVNGLLVAIPVTDVGAASEEEAAEQGRLLRERVDEVMARLQLVLPVYVLFTKCDLLPGFVEAFADLRKADRGQVWGFTVPLDEERERGELFRERFAELVAAAEERTLRRLGAERQLGARERIYEFPQQLEAVGAPLATFVEALFAENVYQDTPILRGVFFTSGTQEGRVVDRVMTAMAQAFGIRPALADGEPVVEAKSYFLRDVFSEVLFPDQGIAFRNARAVRREALRRWVVAGAAATAALLGLALPLRSFLQNRELARSTEAMVEAVAARLAAPAGGAPPLAELEPLRERVQLLLGHAEAGPPWSMRLGLYRGGELLPHLRRLYAGAVRRLLVDPVLKQDVEEMGGFVRRLEPSGAALGEAEHARFYEKLKLHLLLTAPRASAEPSLGGAEADFVAAQVAARWSAAQAGAAFDPAAPAAVERHARLFVRMLADDPALALPRYEDLVRRVRRVLARLPLSSLAVERLVATLDDRGYDLSLGAILGEPVAALRSEVTVRGAFTRRAYEEVVKQRLEHPEALLELWVLADDSREGEARAAAELERLRSRYFELYVEAWRRFVDSVEVQRSDPLGTLRELTYGEPPPLARLFRQVGFNTRLGGAAGVVARAGEGALDRLRKALGTEAKTAEAAVSRLGEREERRLGPRDVERAFAGFVAFGHAPEPVAAPGAAPPPRATLPLDLYQERLVAVRDALQLGRESGDTAALRTEMAKARQAVQTLVDAREVGWRPRFESLLFPPVRQASEVVVEQAGRETGLRWCSTVAPFYQRNLAGRYPFARGGVDAALADVAAFYRPRPGVLWDFYEKELQGAVQRSADGFRFAPQPEGRVALRPELLPFLRRSQEVSAALFPAGAAEPSVPFSVRVHPAPGVAATLLEIDGQRVDYRNGPEEWQRLAWPGDGKSAGGSLRVRTADGAEDAIVAEGEWGLFRLLEAGAVVGDPGAREFSMAFPMRSLGATVTIDFRPARSDTPFFGGRHGPRARLLEPFRSEAGFPLHIVGGVTCPADEAGRGR